MKSYIGQFDNRIKKIGVERHPYHSLEWRPADRRGAAATYPVRTCSPTRRRRGGRRPSQKPQDPNILALMSEASTDVSLVLVTAFTSERTVAVIL